MAAASRLRPLRRLALRRRKLQESACNRWPASPECQTDRGNHFTYDPRGSTRREARVIADDDAVLRLFVFQYVGSDRARHAAHVVKGEVVAPPWFCV